MEEFTSRPRKKRKKKYTFMVVPHSESEPISLPLPLWLINGLAVIGTISLIVFIFFAASYLRLEMTTKENKDLKLTNDYQEKEIAYLRDITRSALDKLDEIKEVESKVKEMVGLEQKASDTTVSRSGPQDIETLEAQRLRAQSAPALTFEATDESASDLIREIKENVQALNEIAPQRKEELDTLETDVKAQLAKLAALPSAWPARGRITSTFGWRSNPFNSRRSEFHNGLDIASSYGTPIKVAGAGKVTFSGWKAGYGYTVIVSHGYGYASYYHHCSKLLVSEGQSVVRGDVIARMGSTGRSTGTHVHFGVTYNGNFINPYNVLK